MWLVLPVTHQGWPRVDVRAVGLPETGPEADAFPSEACHSGQLAQPSAGMATSHMHSDGDPEQGGRGWGPPHYLSGDVRFSAAPETRTGSLVILVTFGLPLPQVSGHRVVTSSLTAQERPGTAGLIFSRLIILVGGGEDWPSSRAETSSGKLWRVSGTFLSDQDALCMKHKFSTWDLSQDREMPVNSFMKLKNW